MKEPNIGTGVAAGVVGGLVGSWVMLRWIEGVGPKLERRAEGRPEPTEDEARRQEEQTESVTMQAAETFYRLGTGDGHLSHGERAEAGDLVHYAFGALMGVAYGVAAEYVPAVGVGMGTAFGTALWMGTDLTSIPVVGYAAPPWEEPASAHVSHWAAHLVYGVAMEAVRRLVKTAF